jgi:hypothetical protein
MLKSFPIHHLGDKMNKESMPERYHFALDKRVFDYVGGVDSLYAFKLRKSNYHLIINTQMDVISWGDANPKIMLPISFEEVFESVPPEIGVELAFHFNIFLKEKN